MSLSYQMCHKYGSASKVSLFNITLIYHLFLLFKLIITLLICFQSVRELPVIKYAKKLGNQVLSGLKYLREGVQVDGKEYVLEHPNDIVEEESDSRPFVRVVSHGMLCIFVCNSN